MEIPKGVSDAIIKKASNKVIFDEGSDNPVELQFNSYDEAEEFLTSNNFIHEEYDEFGDKIFWPSDYDGYEEEE